MARRYSGNTRIYVNHYPTHRAYLSSVVTPEGRWAGWVEEPTILGHPARSSEAFDFAAHTALSCAADEDPDVKNHAEACDRGWVVKRRHV